MKVLALIPSSKLVKNVVRDVLYGCWCSGKRIGGATVPPYAMLSVASFLKQAGYDVSLLDASAERLSWDEIKKRASNYDVILLNSATMSIREDALLVEQIKKINPSLKVIVFGSHSTFMPRSTLSFGVFDAVIRGEPEEVALDILQVWSGGNRLDGVSGVAYTLGDEIFEGSLAKPTLDMEKMPFLDVDMLPKGVEYFNPVVHRFPYITTVTSRGCPGKCTFCTAPTFYGKRIRTKSPRRVVDEMEFYVSKGYSEIYFRDETFTFLPKRAVEICELIIQRGLDVSWIANARVGTINPELAKLMKAAGCHLVKFGVESGVQEILDRSKKGIQLERTVLDIETVKQAGMDVHAHMMLGMPGETKETLETTIAFARKLNPTTVTFGICTPFAGTPLFSEVLEQCAESIDGTEVDLYHEHRNSYLNELYTDLKQDELESALRRAYREFYLRPRYVLERLVSIRSLGQLRNLIIAGLNLFSFSVSSKGAD